MPLQIRDSRIRWEIVWLLCAGSISIAANLYTGEPVYSVTVGHLLIALVAGAIPTALIFGVVETFVFMRGLLHSTTSPR